ncbi:unnamed protein product [Acanthoscelides obtectus]|uniref:Uncharacterized protein n=1 Tax=Acanthoscelides obtectus TaxID=200917 RepID=A0A9P0PSQ5_ACAOB|nr:unnamed protein product [Acanthoscelides obtectus]CAK1663178.1 MYCBP-associated protein [Acanthoscelides obtectus]
MPLSPCCCLGSKKDASEGQKDFQKSEEKYIVDGAGNYQGNNLRHWEAWLEKRKQIHSVLGKKLNKEPGELLMNLGEECHKIKEERELIEYANINTYYDKYRGNPEFWKLPFGIKERCPPSRDPIMFSKKKKQDMNQIPDIEYFGTPDPILEEKSLLPRSRTLYKRWKNSNYRKKTFYILWETIQAIQPHNPDINNLVILGQAVKCVQEKKQICSQHSPTSFAAVSASTVSLEEQHSEPASAEPNSVTSNTFKINGKSISTENNLVDGCLRIRLFFSTIIHSEDKKTDYVIFDNKGQNTIRFYWSKVEKFRTFRDILPNRQEDCFFFNKNELVLIPNKTIKLPVVFFTKNPGTYNELWEIITSPKIWGDDFQLLLQLQGIAQKKDTGKEVNRIKNELATFARNTAIKELLDSIFVDCSYSDMPPKLLKFSEKDMFESANIELIGVEKRSKYAYDQQLVGELKQFFESVRQDGDEITWNLSIKVLEGMAMRKDIVSYVENQTKQYVKARERRIHLKRKYSETKYDEIEMPAQQPTEEPTKPEKSHFKKLKAILRQLEQPSVKKNKEREKHTAAFFVMRTYIAKISEALYNLDKTSKPPNFDYHPCYNYRKVATINDLPDRMIYERFDDVWVERMKRTVIDECPGFLATEKPEKIKNISPENTKLLYSAYFNHPLPADGKGKGKRKGLGKEEVAAPKAPKEKGKGKGDKSKTTGRISSQLKITTAVKEDFNPFKEKFCFNYEGSASEPDSIVSLEQHTEYALKVPEEYNYDKYVAVYSLLSEAIDTMMCAVDSFHENSVDEVVQHELQDCNIVSIPQTLADSTRKSTKETEGEGNEVDDDADAYYNFLLRANLTDNKNTEDYMIKSKVKHEIEEEPPAEPQEPSNLFKQYTRNREAILEHHDTYEDKEMQTSVIDLSKLKQISNPYLNHTRRVSIVSDKVSEYAEEEEVSDEFYILSNDAFRERQDGEAVEDCVEETVEFKEHGYEKEAEDHGGNGNYGGAGDRDSEIYDEKYEL